MFNKLLLFVFKHPVIVIVVILIFPVVVGILYAMPFLRIIAIEPAPLLSYYGVAFGLIGSMLVYLDNRARQQIAKKRNAVPDIDLGVKKIAVGLEAEIRNVGKEKVTDLYLYDKSLDCSLHPKGVKRVTFSINSEVNKPGVIGISGYDDFDENRYGYPSYVQMCVCDDLGRSWNLVYERTGAQEAPEYPLTAAELVSW